MNDIQTQRMIQQAVLLRSREEQLFIQCLSCIFSATPAHALFLSTLSPQDWELLFILAKRHFVLPMLSHVIRHHQQHVPDDVYQRAGQYIIQNTQRNLMLTSELVTIAKALQDKQIKFIVFKGVVLSLEAYGNLSQRVVGDIDILAEPEDQDIIIDILGELDYLPAVSYSWQLMFTSATSNSSEIDVHWQLTSFPKFPFQMPIFDQLFASTHTVSLSDDCSVATFSLQDDCILMGIQVVRGCYEGKPSLKQLCDFTKLVTRMSPSDWNHIAQKLEQNGLTRPFLLALDLTQKLFAINVSIPLDAFAAETHITSWFLSHVDGLLFKRRRRNVFAKLYIRRVIQRPIRYRLLLIPCLLQEMVACIWIYYFKSILSR